MYSTRSHCISPYACIAAQAEGTPMFIAVFMVAIIAPTLILHIWTQTKQNEEETRSEINPGEQIKIDIPNQVTIPVPSLQKTPQVLDTSCYSGGTSPKMENEVESNESAAATDQTDNSGVTSQTAQPPTQTTAVAESPAQVPELKTAVKMAFLVITISVGGIFSVVAGLIEDKKTGLTHNVLFKAYVSLSYISFLSGVVLFLLILMPPTLPRLVTIVKITMWGTLGSITYAIGCATCIVLQMSLVEVVLVLVAPLAVVFVLLILSFSSPRN